MSERQTKHVLSAVIATGILSFSGVLIETAMNVTFPILMKEYGISTAAVQWVTTIYLLMIAVTVPLSGYLMKNYSLKKLFILSNILFLIGVILDFSAPTFTLLLLGRLLQGAATGIALPLMFQIILTEAPRETRGMMMGIGTLTTSIAPAIGPSYGGFLTTHFSWHYIYLALIPLLLLSLILGTISMKSTKVYKQTKLNLKNVLTLIICFSSWLIFFSLIGQSMAWFFLAAGFISGFFFVNQSRRSEEPLVRLELLKHSAFRHFLFSFLAYQFILLGISFILPNFIQIVAKHDAAAAGVAMFPGALVGAILAPISGKILDHHGPRKPLIYGVIGALSGLSFLMFALSENLPLPWLVFGHVFYMIGLGFSYSNFITTAMNHLPPAEYSDGNALFNTLQQFTGAIATSIIAAIIGWQQNSAVNFVSGTKSGAVWSMSLLVLLAVLSLISTLKILKTKTNPLTNQN